MANPCPPTSCFASSPRAFSIQRAAVPPGWSGLSPPRFAAHFGGKLVRRY